MNADEKKKHVILALQELIRRVEGSQESDGDIEMFTVIGSPRTEININLFLLEQ